MKSSEKVRRKNKEEDEDEEVEGKGCIESVRRQARNNVLSE